VRLFRVSVADAFSTDENRPKHSSSRIEGDFQIPVGSSPIRTELHFRGNFRIGGYSSEMPIPSTDFVGSNNRSNAKSDHRMVIDADSPASSKAAASRL